MGVMNKSLIIIGFGQQGKSWAFNLRDSGWNPLIALRPGSASRKKASRLGFDLVDWKREAWPLTQAIALLTPDETHQEILQNLKTKISAESLLLYAHGYSYVYAPKDCLNPMWQHALLCPKTSGKLLRRHFEKKKSIPGFYSLEGVRECQQEKVKTLILTIAQDLGINLGPFATSFRNETFANLFAEQAVHCSILPYASLYCYNLLREKGIEKELAFFETWNNLKLIADMMIKFGPQKFFQQISANALIGSEKGREVILDESYKEKLNALYSEIENGLFQNQVQETELGTMRKNISNFWKQQEVSTTYETFAKRVFHED